MSRLTRVLLALVALSTLGSPRFAAAWYPVPDIENDHGQCVTMGGYNAEIYYRSSFEGLCGGVCGTLEDVQIHGTSATLWIEGGYAGQCRQCALDLLDQAFVVALGTYESCMGSGGGGCSPSNPWC